MPGLARFILSGPMQGALVAAALLVSALVLPPVVINSGMGALFLLALVLAVALLFSAASVALVWLRKSATESATTTAIALVGSALLSWLSLGTVWPAILLAMALWLPVIPLAWILRYTIRLELAVLAAAAIGSVVVIGVHLALGDATAFWLERLREMFAAAPTPEGMAMSQQQTDEVLQQIAGMMTGIMVASFVMNALSSLFLARWWQAKLFNPGGFRDEFHGLRLGRTANLGLGVIIFAGLFLPVPLIYSVAVIMMFVAMLQGLAVSHGVVALREMNKGWLVALYVLIGLIPHTALILAILGIADSWVDFRARASRGSAS